MAEVNRDVTQCALPLALLAPLCSFPQKRREENIKNMKRNGKEGVSIANTPLKTLKRVTTKHTKVSTHWDDCTQTEIHGKLSTTAGDIVGSKEELS